MLTRRNLARRLGDMLAALAATPLARAATYPTRRVKIITTVAAGGTVDVLARLIAEKLSESLGQSFYVEDIPGGGGKMGAAAAARSAPDGYTILFVFNSFITDISLYSDVPYDPIKDFAPVTLVATSPYVLINGNRPPISVISSLREPKNWPRSSSSPASSRNNHPNPDVRIMSDP
jgi:tripartite-type tricarboxylate transporter receptor subunit TctC